MLQVDSASTLPVTIGKEMSMENGPAESAQAAQRDHYYLQEKSC